MCNYCAAFELSQNGSLGSSEPQQIVPRSISTTDTVPSVAALLTAVSYHHSLFNLQHYAPINAGSIRQPPTGRRSPQTYATQHTRAGHKSRAIGNLTQYFYTVYIQYIHTRYIIYPSHHHHRLLSSSRSSLSHERHARY